MTERNGLLPRVNEKDCDKLIELLKTTNFSLDNLLDKIEKENPVYARIICQNAILSKDLQQTCRAGVYIYTLLDFAAKREYAFSFHDCLMLPAVKAEYETKLKEEMKNGFEIEMIERMREDNPLLATIVDSLLMHGKDAKMTLETAAIAYRLLEIAAIAKVKSEHKN